MLVCAGCVKVCINCLLIVLLGLVLSLFLLVCLCGMFVACGFFSLVELWVLHVALFVNSVLMAVA